jgi:hypothetical protein
MPFHGAISQPVPGRLLLESWNRVAPEDAASGDAGLQRL